MALSNHERVGKALELLKDGLAPFVERELKAQDAQGLAGEGPPVGARRPRCCSRTTTIPEWDAASLLAVMWEPGTTCSARPSAMRERSLVSELRDVRNKWAHQEPFSSDDADRALDSPARLLTAVSAPQADEVQKMKMELLRLIFDEQVRGEKRKAGGSPSRRRPPGALKPWREVVMPHADVASGRYQQAEFAADLWQVHLGEGTDEYREPGGVLPPHLPHREPQAPAGGRRRSGSRARAATRWCSSRPTSAAARPTRCWRSTTCSRASRRGAGRGRRGARGGRGQEAAEGPAVVLVGNKISPGNPVSEPDGTVVRTLWGELAWQLGGKKAYARVQADDEKAPAPATCCASCSTTYGPAWC
jgi:hypothetical protein